MLIISLITLCRELSPFSLSLTPSCPLHAQWLVNQATHWVLWTRNSSLLLSIIRAKTREVCVYVWVSVEGEKVALDSHFVLTLKRLSFLYLWEWWRSRGCSFRREQRSDSKIHIHLSLRKRLRWMGVIKKMEDYDFSEWADRSGDCVRSWWWGERSCGRRLR